MASPYFERQLAANGIDLIPGFSFGVWDWFKPGLQPPTVALQGDCVVLTFRLAQGLGGGSGKTPDLVLARLQEVPQASIPELAEYLGKSASAMERAIRKLREEGRLQRIGPAKGGYWKMLENHQLLAHISR